MYSEYTHVVEEDMTHDTAPVAEKHEVKNKTIEIQSSTMNSKLGNKSPTHVVVPHNYASNVWYSQLWTTHTARRSSR